MSILSEIYKAEQRQRSASILYAPTPVAPTAKPSHYIPNQYAGLQDYKQERPSPYEQAAGESDANYTARLRPLLQALTEQLPADELAAVAASYNGAVERLEGGQTHEQLRAHLDASGHDRGILGGPAERAAALGSRGHGIRAVPAQGHLAAAATQRLNLIGHGAEHVSLSILDRMPKPDGPVVAHRVDVSQLRSTGNGVL